MSDAIVNVSISLSAPGLTRESFGIPLVIGYHNNFAARHKTYNLSTATTDLLTDGFTVNDPVYRKVAGLAANTPAPQTVIVGRLLTAYSHKGTLTVLSDATTEGQVIDLQVLSPDGTVTDISYTVPAAATTTTVATALAALITAVTDLTASSTAEVINWAADNTGETFLFDGMDLELLDYADTTIDTNLVTELDQIRVQNDTWYTLHLADAESKARIEALAANVETKDELFLATSFDGNNLDPNSTSSVAYSLKQSAYFRTALIFSNDQSAKVESNWAGNRLPDDPGSATWIYKTLSGPQPDDLNATHITALDANNCSYYQEDSGRNVTKGAKVAGGEWIDVIRFRDWLIANIRDNMKQLLFDSKKVPYTDGGIQLIVANLDSSLQQGVTSGGIDGEQEITILFPRISEVPGADKLARILRNVSFSCTLAGAIHVVEIKGALAA